MKLRFFFLTFLLTIAFNDLNSMSHWVVFGDLDQDFDTEEQKVITDFEEFKAEFIKRIKKLKINLHKLYNEEGIKAFLSNFEVYGERTSQEEAMDLLNSLLPGEDIAVTKELLESEEVKKFVLQQVRELLQAPLPEEELVEFQDIESPDEEKKDIAVLEEKVDVPQSIWMKMIRFAEKPQTVLGFTGACLALSALLLYKQGILNYETLQALFKR